MSKRNRIRRSAVPGRGEPTRPLPAAETTAPPGADALRRVLLVLLSTLLVARPIVGGEFPGLTSEFADPGGLTLPFLVLLGGAAWGVWRLWSGYEGIHVAAVDLAVFALVPLLFAGAGAATYQRPAWLAAWDWLGIVVTFFLVRQLAVRPEERHGLTAVILAVAVAIAGEAVYQSAVTLPRSAAAAAEATGGTTAYLREQLSERSLAATPLELLQLTRRLDDRQAHGPYFHPESLAAFLVLTLPVLVGAVVASRRGGSARWLTVLLGACAALVAAALVLTRVAPAVAAAVVIGVATMAVLHWPARWGGWRTGLLLSVVVATLAAWLMPAAVGALRREVWPAAWQVGVHHFWRGVGPAGFGLFYPHYMAPTAGPRLTDPFSALLGLWADGGVLVPLVFLAVVSLGVVAVARWWRDQATATDDEPAETTEEAGASGATIRWEYYAGGMVGLVLSFILRAGALPMEDVVDEAIAAGLRAVLWFAAFGLLEGVAWSLSEHVAALAAGLAGFILLMLVGSGIDYPSVTGPALAILGLLLATVRPAAWVGRLRVTNLLATPLFLATAGAFFLFVFYPAANTDNVIRRAQLGGLHFFREMTKPAAERGLHDPEGYIRERLLAPLERARKEDPDNTRLLVLLATWNGQLWAMAPDAAGRGSGSDPSRFPSPPTSADRAVSYAVLAQQVNPNGPDGYLAELDVRLRIATVLRQVIRRIEQEPPKGTQPVPSPEERKVIVARLQTKVREQYQLAGEVIERYLPFDPTDPVLRYQLAAVLHEAGNVRQGRAQAAEARRLDALAAPPRNLSDPQREQLDHWLTRQSGS